VSNNTQAALDDKLAKNRTLSTPEPEAIPEPPAGYERTEPELRAARLKRVSKKLEAEVLESVKECAALGDRMPELLGAYAPPGEEANRLAEELERVMTALSKTEELLAFLEEKKAILLSDARGYNELVMREYEHHVGRKPGLATTFKDTVRFDKAIGEAISEGMAEARRRKAEEEARAKAAGE
jgi:hypothetical protein